MRIYVILLSFFVFSSNLLAEMKGDIHLFCKPKVQVYLDGEFIGKTTKSDSGIYVSKVSLGKHKIRLMKRGKSNEVLTFSVNHALLEIESNKYNIGKFTKEERNAKLIPEGFGKIVINQSQQSSAGIPSGLDIYLNVKPEVSDLYIPAIDENYSVDSLPIIRKLIPIIYFSKDKAITIEKDEVLVRGLVGPKGNVDSVVIISSCGNTEYDSIANLSALNTKYVPALKDANLTWYWMSWSIPIVTNDDDEYIPAFDEFVPVEVLPKTISYINPESPKNVKKSNIKGPVWVKALVNRQGNVIKVMLHESSGVTELDNAALEVAPLSKFTPGIQNSIPVAVWVTYKVEFKLIN